MKRTLLALAACTMAACTLAACASAAPSMQAEPVDAAAIDTASVIERTERAFAADAGIRGWVASFKTYAADDAVVLWSGRPDNAQAAISSLPDSTIDTSLKWRPLWVGAARSGDFGFSTGPVFNGTSHSQYFSIWRKNADGAWRWIYDGGFSSDGPPPGAEDAPATHAPLAARGAGARAMEEVKAEEEKIANASVNDYRAALSGALAGDGRVLGAGPQPAPGEAARAAGLAARPAKVSLGTLGGAQSTAGDMVYTYGSTLWVEGGETVRRGHYVRVWRLDAPGWRIVADLFLPKREPSAG